MSPRRRPRPRPRPRNASPTRPRTTRTSTRTSPTSCRNSSSSATTGGPRTRRFPARPSTRPRRRDPSRPSRRCRFLRTTARADMTALPLPAETGRGGAAAATWIFRGDRRAPQVPLAPDRDGRRDRVHRLPLPALLQRPARAGAGRAFDSSDSGGVRPVFYSPVPRRHPAGAERSGRGRREVHVRSFLTLCDFRICFLAPLCTLPSSTRRQRRLQRFLTKSRL